MTHLNEFLPEHHVLSEEAIDKLNLPKTVPLSVYEVPGDLSSRKVIGEARVELVNGEFYASMTVTDKKYKDILTETDYSEFSIGTDSATLLNDIDRVEDGRQTFKEFDGSDFRPKRKSW